MKKASGLVLALLLLINFQSRAQQIAGFQDGNYEGSGYLRSRSHSNISTKVTGRLMLSQGLITAKAKATLWGIPLWPEVTLIMKLIQVPTDSSQLNYNILDMNQGGQKIGLMTCKSMTSCEVKVNIPRYQLVMNEVIELSSPGKINVYGIQNYRVPADGPFFVRNKQINTVFQGRFKKTTN